MFNSGRRVRRNAPVPGRHNLEELYREEFLSAIDEAHRILSEFEVPHAVIGGVAIGYWGAVRSTRDIDLVVDESAFEWRPFGRRPLRRKLRQALDAVPGKIDIFWAPDGDAADLVHAIGEATVFDGVPVAPLEAILASKLLRGRFEDLGDVTRAFEQKLIAPRALWDYVRTRTPSALPALARVLDQLPPSLRRNPEVRDVLELLGRDAHRAARPNGRGVVRVNRASRRASKRAAPARYEEEVKRILEGVVERYDTRPTPPRYFWCSPSACCTHRHRSVEAAIACATRHTSGRVDIRVWPPR